MSKQLELFDSEKKHGLSGESTGTDQRHVECLGMTFANDDERRQYFRGVLREKLKDPEFRKIEGFPLGSDEDILALSDPPYYTACPNPFIDDFLKHYGRPYDPEEPYSREPFAADVSEGKNDPIYNAHSYHTKVPHKAIMRYILHYTEHGDIVFDGFCGTGMTGVAAQLCGDRTAVESLGYKVDDQGVVYRQEEYIDESGKKRTEWTPFSKLGVRYAILNDLSPAATFIAYNYNTPVDVAAFEREAKRILEEVEDEYGWMYATLAHGEPGSGLPTLDESMIREVADRIKQARTADEVRKIIAELTTKSSKAGNGRLAVGKINYTVWSDVFICPDCTQDVIFWDAAVDKKNGKVNDTFFCPHCRSELAKRSCARAQETHFDTRLNEFVTMAKQVPVLINYSVGNKRFEKTPDEYDLALIEKINNMEIPYWYPIDRMCEGRESRRNDRYGITHVHQFYTRRALFAFAVFNKKCSNKRLLWLLTSTIEGSSKLNRERPSGLPSKLSGTLYVSSMVREIDVFSFIKRKIEKYTDAIKKLESMSNIITLQSCLDMSNIKENVIDYIFTDPPFGGNLNYSELSFIWEAWLKVFTNQKTEAIINAVQGKGLLEYQSLMTQCFSECYRILKPGRWMTVEFHNSQNSVWNAIQESLQRSGFIIADVRTLDKQQGSFKQVTTTSAVKQDLVISAYKPKESFKREFISHAGSEETAWSFVRQHLENLPVVVVKNGKIELIAERQAFLLYDRMVAYHIMNGIAVPLDATDFYKGLDERFMKRDGMYFLADQVNEYDTARIVNDVEPVQFELFVTNEKSAIAWLYQQLETPQTYAELQPKFMQEIKAWDKFEVRPELAVLLEENFLQDDKGRWYIPDITKAADVAKLREKKLLKEFEGYLATKGKLKLFRTEAIRVGFAKLWADKNYKLIVETAERLPEKVIQEDDKLLMYYDLSLGRI
jgi:DNA modification methylase